MNFDERKYVLVAAVVLICIVFVLRLFWIQVVDDSWTARAADISERKITVFPSRGLILDRDGGLLVANTPVYDIMVVPREVKNLDTLGLSQLLNVPMDQVRERLRKASEYSVWKPSEFEKQITAEQYAAVSVHLYKYPGFYGQSRTLRTYPPHLAAHMLGYLSEVSARKVEQDPYYKPGDVIGVGGLESYYEKDLRGKRGVKYVVVDVHNNVQGSYKNGTRTLCAAPAGAQRNPIHEYDHNDSQKSPDTVGCTSITGGAFVPQGVWPAGYGGSYLFADYVCGKIFQITPSGA